MSKPKLSWIDKESFDNLSDPVPSEAKETPKAPSAETADSPIDPLVSENDLSAEGGKELVKQGSHAGVEIPGTDHHTDDEIHNLKRALATSAHEVTTLTQQLEAAHKELSNLHLQQSPRETETPAEPTPPQPPAELKPASKEMKKLKRELKISQAEYRAQAAELEGLHRDLTHLRMENMNLDKKVKQIRNIGKDESGTGAPSLTTLRTENIALQAESKQLHTETVELKQKLMQTNSELSEVKESLIVKNVAATNAALALKQQSMELERLQKKATSANNQELNSLKKHVTELQSQLSEARLLSRENQQSSQTVQEQLDQNASQIAQLKSKLSREKKERETAQSRIRKLQAQLKQPSPSESSLSHTSPPEKKKVPLSKPSVDKSLLDAPTKKFTIPKELQKNNTHGEEAPSLPKTSLKAPKTTLEKAPEAAPKEESKKPSALPKVLKEALKTSGPESHKPKETSKAPKVNHSKNGTVPTKEVKRATSVTSMGPSSIALSLLPPSPSEMKKKREKKAEGKKTEDSSPAPSKVEEIASLPAKTKKPVTQVSKSSESSKDGKSKSEDSESRLVSKSNDPVLKVNKPMDKKDS